MDTIKIKKPSRPPPRLRTKTGCYKCRERRKKCDERRPICTACERLQIECVYRSPANHSNASPETSQASQRTRTPDSLIDSLPTISPRNTSLWLRPAGLRTEQDWNIFQYCSTRYIQLLTSPDATSEFRDVSFVFAIGFDEPWVMHAALAPAALHASCAALIPKEDAMIYTQSAIQGLRQAIQAPTRRHTSREPFLAATLFLGVFEDFYSSHASQSLTHYCAMAQVLEEQAVIVPRFEISQLPVFWRTLLDSVLYHFSTRLIFEQDIDAICNSFPCQTVAKYIDALEGESKGSGRNSSILPVLGRTPPGLFLQIYQITWLSRQLPFNYGHNYALALQCWTELDHFQETCTAIGSEDVEPTEISGSMGTSNSEIAAKLYFLATRIFIAKVLNPEGVCNTSPHIYTLFAKGVELLKLYDGSAPCGQFICWPILILGCTACPVTNLEAAIDYPHDTPSERLRWEMRVLIQNQLLDIWKVSYSGYVRRTAGALERIWNLPDILIKAPDDGYSSSSGVEYDGLNALIYKKGLGTALLSSGSA
ncbi:uncharacterized protein Z518_09855 [Rhinocladiella mackenziei CBS 650.93]|uniref:Zn(2)-C6 fungal-type domain-containing protein n=1 Tax=Rhinocladiella mackenziei CBS 650.93 TaxID=1442369 RepID=A0A0D2IVR3_9EURO|nr:uncharacterized protein Z518_09855 [Rhinocladiella mackenziei CBS 650.93]KIX00790.1 hypothetical protein Z518_09855 [Rhinocladiella mackenziei CBS 650.93]